MLPPHRLRTQVFQVRSTLFDAELATRIADWYNTTPGSPDLDQNMVPLGFPAAEIEGGWGAGRGGL